MSAMSAAIFPVLLNGLRYRALKERAKEILQGVDPLTPEQIRVLHVETLWQS